MHVLLEGVVPYELTLMLKNFILEEKYFTLDELNQRILSFTYTEYEAKDRPSIIQDNVINSHSKRNITQSCELNMLLLGHNYECPCYSCSNVESVYQFALDDR